MPDDDCYEHIIAKIELLNTTLITIEIRLRNLAFVNQLKNVEIKEGTAQLGDDITSLENKSIVDKYLQALA